MIRLHCFLVFPVSWLWAVAAVGTQGAAGLSVTFSDGIEP